MRAFIRAFVLALFEKLPLVGLADVNDDGKVQLVFGPQSNGFFGKFLKELPDKEVSFWRFAVVLGVR